MKKRMSFIFILILPALLMGCGSVEQAGYFQDGREFEEWLIDNIDVEQTDYTARSAMISALEIQRVAFKAGYIVSLNIPYEDSSERLMLTVVTQDNHVWCIDPYGWYISDAGVFPDLESYFTNGVNK